MKITKRGQSVEFAEYSLDYHWKDKPSHGWSFSCDSKGVPLASSSSENLEKCQNGTYDVEFQGIVKRVQLIHEPDEGTCECGRTVYLEGDSGHGIDCDCGRIYNLSGQELAPRSQWEDRWDVDSTQPYCKEFGYAE